MPFRKSDEVICKGDFILGTACGKCSKCLEQKKSNKQDNKNQPVKTNVIRKG